MNIYLLGIAGAGVSALASLLHSQGHRVSGSDQGVYPPVSSYLDRIGIPYHDRFDPADLPADIDLVISGASAKLGGGDNPVLKALAARGLPVQSFPEHLGQIAANRHAVVIAGSFGKSSLTALIAHLMRSAGRDPGYFIGAVPLDLDRTGHGGTDPELILEGDEYVISPEDRRSKFVLYHPKTTLISSLVHDHVNMFPTMADYEAPFAELIALTPQDGVLLCARGHEPLERLTKGRQVVWYGLGAGPGYGAIDIVVGEVTRFTLTTPQGDKIPLQTQLLGLHNVENIVGAAALLLERGWISIDQLIAAIPTHRGVARRLDRKTTRATVPIYEGFGSSYEKARSAIEAIGLHFKARPLTVVFEPHTFSWRNAEALAWYDTVFAGVARVVLLPPPTHGASAHAQIDQPAIAARIAATGVPVSAVADGTAAIAALEDTPSDGVVLLLSSGPLDGLAERLPPVFEARFSPPARA